MNRGRKIKSMRRKICHYGKIVEEYYRPKDEFYRKGSYYTHFISDVLDLSCTVGAIDKYKCYKSIIKTIDEVIMK